MSSSEYVLLGVWGQEMAAWGAAQERERMQARIDALMLEYCPDEMSDEQKQNWAANQVPAQQGVDRDT